MVLGCFGVLVITGIGGVIGWFAGGQSSSTGPIIGCLIGLAIGFFIATEENLFSSE